MVRRLFCGLLALLMLVFGLLVSSPGEAQALEYHGSKSYESGKYYQRLTQVRMTKDPRTNIVRIALSQVGYQEGNNSKQLSGEIYGKGNCTEYGRWYGIQAMWCAMFVSWCADVAGVSTKVIPKHSYTPEGLAWFKARGRAYTGKQVLAGKYIPQPGDIVYFRSDRNKNPTNHVGIVTDYRAGYLYTVEGNASSKTIDTNGGTIAQKVYHVSDKYIVAICCPNYITLGNVRPAVVSAYVPCRCHDQQNLLDAPDELQFIQNPLILYER